MASRFDLSKLRDALEQSDLEGIMECYADDAELTVIDQAHQPTHPLALRGRDQIRSFYEDVCGREMTHRMDHEVSSDGHVSFVEECEYPDGCHVMAAQFLDLNRGKISRQLVVQAWDETTAQK